MKLVCCACSASFLINLLAANSEDEEMLFVVQNELRRPWDFDFFSPRRNGRGRMAQRISCSHAEEKQLFHWYN